MNYLAHFQLSHGNDGLIVGGLLGDFVKGPLKGEFNDDWERGIRLHRRIDAFTDSHAVVKAGQQLFDPEYRRYSGIMLDVIFDHFLNVHWHHFHPESLDVFSRDVYRALNAAAQMPAKAKLQADNLVKYDVLTNVQHWQTITATLQRISERLKGDNPMATAGDILLQHYQPLEQLFLDFYPEVQAHANTFRQQL